MKRLFSRLEVIAVVVVAICLAVLSGGQKPSRAADLELAAGPGGTLTLSMQVAKWLDTYLATSALANSNPANRPTLLQVLGDSTLGAKAHGGIIHIEGEAP